MTYTQKYRMMNKKRGILKDAVAIYIAILLFTAIAGVVILDIKLTGGEPPTPPPESSTLYYEPAGEDTTSTGDAEPGSYLVDGRPTHDSGGDEISTQPQPDPSPSDSVDTSPGSDPSQPINNSTSPQPPSEDPTPVVTSPVFRGGWLRTYLQLFYTDGTDKLIPLNILSIPLKPLAIFEPSEDKQLSSIRFYMELDVELARQVYAVEVEYLINLVVLIAEEQIYRKGLEANIMYRQVDGLSGVVIADYLLTDEDIALILTSNGVAEPVSFKLLFQLYPDNLKLTIYGDEQEIYRYPDTLKEAGLVLNYMPESWTPSQGDTGDNGGGGDTGDGSGGGTVCTLPVIGIPCVVLLSVVEVVDRW